VYEHSSGKIENRQQAISGIIHNQSKYEEDILPTPVSVVEKGDSIVTKKVFKAVEKKADGTTGQLNITIELVWIKENGDWKLIRRKATKNI
jgi:ketosteroid isomerase-like protein